MSGRCRIGLWRSLVSALHWGCRGREFKSRQPDQQTAPRETGIARGCLFRKALTGRSGGCRPEGIGVVTDRDTTGTLVSLAGDRRGRIRRLGPARRDGGCPRSEVLVVTGSRSAASSGTLDRVRTYLEGGPERDVMPVVREEPTDAVVDELRAAIRSEGCTGVVAVGGGSSLDAGKAAAGLSYSEASTHEHMVGKAAIPSHGLPWIGVPTTAGSGAEMTPNAVLIDTVTGIKKSLRSWSWLAHAAIVDPDLTLTMPPQITAASGMDALTQAIESYTSTGATPLTEAISLEAAKRIAGHLLRAYTAPHDRKAREQVAWGSMMAGLALANARLGAARFRTSVGCGLAHGLACAILLPSVIRFNAPVAGEVQRIGACPRPGNGRSHGRGGNRGAVRVCTRPQCEARHSGTPRRCGPDGRHDTVHRGGDATVRIVGSQPEDRGQGGSHGNLGKPPAVTGKTPAGKARARLAGAGLVTAPHLSR